MTTTPEQNVAISALLSIDLSTVTDDRLIELCLLYRAAPSALPAFTVALQAEITRRFTAAEIATNDVMFSVINNFNNQFNPELQYKEKMYEFVNAPDQDLWLTQNVTFFENTLGSPERMTWITDEGSVINALSLNTNAMAKVVASSVAMAKIAVSSIALSKIAVAAAARNALMANNTVFQSVKQQIYNTVVTSWTKQAGVSGNAIAGNPITAPNSAVTSPEGFVFASLGWYSTYTTGKTEASHPDGTIAATANSSSSPTTLSKLDVISFNGATFTARINFAQAYAELWIPPAS